MSRILVIDEEPGSRLVLQSRFSEQDYEVMIAETGAKGLAEARNTPFDVILVSAQLKSGVDAVEVCRRLKSHPSTVNSPLLVFQNHAGDQEVMSRAYEAGCESFVSKAEMPTLDHVVHVMLRLRAQQESLGEEKRTLLERVRRLEEESSKGEKEGGLRETGDYSQLFREFAASRPDALLLVDSEGYVRQADRAACEIFGSRLEGGKLGSLAPASGLEAFVRDARTEVREGFRFDLSSRQRPARSFTASVTPLVPSPGVEDPGLKIVILMDAAKRRVAAELLRVQEPGVSRTLLGPLLESARQVYAPKNFLGATVPIEELRSKLVDVACQHGNVLLVGERGSGKERIARTLHFAGTAGGPFAQINCASLSPESFENELFGYVKGAFKGAAEDRPGLFHQVQDGTLFLEEVGALSKDLQKVLVEVLKQKQFSRRGTSRMERVDVRMIAGASSDLAAQVRGKSFSEELLDLLSGIVMAIPPLRERQADIHILVREFMQRFGSARGVKDLAPVLPGVLENYPWPGNVSELEDCIEQACARTKDEVIQLEDMPRTLQDFAAKLPERELTPAVRRDGHQKGTHSVPGVPMMEDSLVKTGWVPKELRPWDITDEDPISLDLYEKKVLLRALNQVNGDKLAAARLLNVGKSTLYRKLKRFGIT